MLAWSLNDTNFLLPLGSNIVYIKKPYGSYSTSSNHLQTPLCHQRVVPVNVICNLFIDIKTIFEIFIRSLIAKSNTQIFRKVIDIQYCL